MSYLLLPNLTPPENASEEHVPFLLLLPTLPLRHKVTNKEFIALCSDRSKEAARVCQAPSFLVTVALPSLQPTFPRSAHLCEQRSLSALCQISFCRAAGYETHPVSSTVADAFGPTFQGNQLHLNFRLCCCLLRRLTIPATRVIWHRSLRQLQ